MILRDFDLANTIVQIQYPTAYEIWDRAGDISRKLSGIWPELKISEAQPHQQTLSNKEITLQTGLNQSTITIIGGKAFDQHKIKLIKDTFDVWKKSLELTEYNRISTRTTYAKEFKTIGEANNFLFKLNLAKWPESKVFDQPQNADLNSIEMLYRFEDGNSFSVLRIRTEMLKYEVDLDPRFTKTVEIKESLSRVIIDFDRGLLKNVIVEKFLVDDWLKGYQHLLHRDLEKVIKV